MRPIQLGVAFILVGTTVATQQPTTVPTQQPTTLATRPATRPGEVQEPTSRPRLGLVLSGGGARGITHIGVLQVLEELRVPVDYITGTSMGSIIGGLYAYGLSPEEIERFVLTADWPYILQDYPSRTDLTIRRKQEEYEFLIQLRVGVRDGKIAFPRGLIQGQNLGLVLDQLVIEAIGLASFDTLPIPFRCVAADITDGSRFVLDRGDLSLAMRASMALPGIFSPVEWEGRLLVDGGIIDNLPVAEARRMGAERLIAVDIGTPPLKREEIHDLLGITMQVISVLSEKYVQEAAALLDPRDVLIRPDLGKLTSADFERGAELIRIGKEWAKKHAEQLSRFSVPPEEYARWRARLRRVPKPLPVLAEIRVVTSPSISHKVVEAMLRTKVGDKLDFVRLSQDLGRIYGTDLFEKIRFRLLYRPDGGALLEIEATEKTWGPGFLRFALDASTDFSTSSSFTVGVNYTLTSIGDTDAEWRTRAFLGTNTSIATEWFQPLNVNRDLFVAPALGYERFPRRATIGGGLSNLVIEGVGARLDGGMHFGGWGELRFGIDGRTGEIETEDGIPPSEDDFDDVGLHASFEIDTLNSSIFPTFGVRGAAEWLRRYESLGSDEDFEIVRLTGFGTYTVFDQTFGLLGGVQFETSGQTQLPHAATIGGLFRISGLGPIALAGSEGGVASLITYRNVAGPLYLGGSIEVGGVWDGWDNINSSVVQVGGSVFAGIRSPIGPIYLAYGWAEEGEKAAYLVVGQIY